MAQEDVFKKIVSHCKEYGFVFPSSEINDRKKRRIPAFRRGFLVGTPGLEPGTSAM